MLRADVSSNPPANRETILIVEEDLRMQRVLKRIFLQEHYAVLAATDGRTGSSYSSSANLPQFFWIFIYLGFPGGTCAGAFARETNARRS